jgi:DNA-binding XRE family transcriptional regulator
MRSGTIICMDGPAGTNGVAGHFGRELRRTRVARGWSIAEVARRTGLNPAHLSRIELGRRPPTEKIATALDKVFPEKQGWFSNWHSESQSWPEIPATFKSWPDYEDRSATLRAWTPSILDGLMQTEDYARALIATAGVDRDTASARLRGRMERQRRFWERRPPVRAVFIVDEVALYRFVGSAEVMAEQCRHLAEVAELPNVILQVMPVVAHAVNNSGIMLADTAAWVEHAAAGYVFTDDQTVSSLALRLDTLRAEARTASASLALLNRMAETWDRLGESQRTQTRPAGAASK